MMISRRKAWLAVSMAALMAVPASAALLRFHGRRGSGSFPACLATFNPANPAACGYNVVFNSTFPSTDVDLTNTGNAGFKWYTRKAFSYPTSPSSYFTFDANGMTMTPTVTNGSYTIASAYPTGSTYVGNVFGPGWYVEATIAFNPADVNTANHWPAVWALSIQSMNSPFLDQWPGQATGYRNSVENDLFEYDFNLTTKYGSTLHNWYGISGTTCTPGLCAVHASPGYITVPSDPTWTNYHKISQLWVAGSQNSNNGRVTNYFDDIEKTTYSWVAQGDGTPPPSGTFTFSVIDKYSSAIIIGSGDNQPFKIKSVKVWEHP